MSKYEHRTGDWLESIVNKLGGEEAGEAFLRDELTVVAREPKWREEGGIIYFSLTSDGTTGKAWIDRLEVKGFRLTEYAKQVLRSSDFLSTSKVITQVAVLKGELFEDSERYTKTIRANAAKRNWKKPNTEIVCLIREKFSDKELEEMGLCAIIPMHNPIKDSGGDPNLLGAARNIDGRYLFAYRDNPVSRWERGNGFAFAVRQSASA